MGLFEACQWYVVKLALAGVFFAGKGKKRIVS